VIYSLFVEIISYFTSKNNYIDNSSHKSYFYVIIHIQAAAQAKTDYFLSLYLHNYILLISDNLPSQYFHDTHSISAFDYREIVDITIL